MTFADGRSEDGTVVGTDYDNDVALIQVDTATAEPIHWRETSEDPAIGSSVMALSNPGGEGLRVTVGYVSGVQRAFRGPRGRAIRGSVEHTAPLLPGSSGGPIVDRERRLVGINTNRLGEGFYLAIPADSRLREVIDRLRHGASEPRVRLGVGVAPNEVARRLRRAVGLEEADGLLVRVVEAGSPADRAQIKEGDLLVSVAGSDLQTVEQLYSALAGLEPGASVPVVILRASEMIELTVEFPGGHD